LLLASVLWVIAPVLFHIALHAISPQDPRWRSFGPTDAVAGTCAIGSLALYAYIRRTDRDPRFILDLGLIYMVLSSAALGVLMHWEPPPTMSAGPTITWIGAIVLMTAAFVPSPPGKMLVAGLIAATMNPVGMLIGRARGVIQFGPLSDIIVMHYPDYVLVGVAVVISHVVTRLGQQVARARELGSYELGELLGRGGLASSTTSSRCSTSGWSSR